MALTDDIVAYWKLDESSGNASDATGNGHTLTNTGTAAYNPGLINNGIDLGNNNSTKYLSNGSNLGYGGGVWSMSGWVKAYSTQHQQISRVLWISDVSTFDVMDIYYDSTNQFIWGERLRSNVVGDGISYSLNLPTSTYTHVALTYDGTTVNFYVNGTSVGTTASSGNGISGISSGAAIGADNTGANLISGIIDEVGMWSRALSSSEISALYNGGVGLQYPFLQNTNFFAIL